MIINIIKNIVNLPKFHNINKFDQINIKYTIFI